jgi:hypothetical protein
MKNLINEIKESVVFLGFMNNGHEQIVGTGFLMQINDIFYLVTAKHVIEKNWQNLHVFLNTTQLKAPSAKPLSVIYNNGYSWIRHPDPKVDIAILPFLKDVNDQVRFVPDSLIPKDMAEIHELVDVFYVSFHPGLNSFQNDGCVNPIVRKGVISRVNNNDTFYIDGSAFPGNSGSPIFLFPTPIKISNGGISIGAPTKISLLGVMGAYLPYQDVALSQQTGRPRVIFEENTGLSLIWSTKFIDQIIQSEDFQKQIKSIKDSLSKVPVQNKVGSDPVNKPI